MRGVFSWVSSLINGLSLQMHQVNRQVQKSKKRPAKNFKIKYTALWECQSPFAHYAQSAEIFVTFLYFFCHLLMIRFSPAKDDCSHQHNMDAFIMNMRKFFPG